MDIDNTIGRLPYLSPPDFGPLLGDISRQAVRQALQASNAATIRARLNKVYVQPSGARALLEHRGFVFPKKNISFQILKGGAGKTTLSFSFAVRAAHYGARVLAIDFDKQAHLTKSLCIEGRAAKTWLDIYRGDATAEQAIVKTSAGVDLLPANVGMARLNDEMAVGSRAVNPKNHMRAALAPVRDRYDLVVIDCPPDVNHITSAAACASDLVVIPIDPDPYTIDGLWLVLDDLPKLKQEWGVELDYRIVWNQIDMRRRKSFAYFSDVQSDPQCAGKILPVNIRTDASYSNAAAKKCSIYDDPDASREARNDIDFLTCELLDLNYWKERQGSV